MFSALYPTFCTFILHIKAWFSSLSLFHSRHPTNSLSHPNNTRKDDEEAPPATPIHALTPAVPEMTLALPPPALMGGGGGGGAGAGGGSGGKTRPIPMAIKTTLFDRAGAFPVIPRTPGRLTPNPAATLSARSHPSTSSSTGGNSTPGLESDMHTAPLTATGNSFLLNTNTAVRSPGPPRREELGAHRPVARAGSRFSEGEEWEGVKL